MIKVFICQRKRTLQTIYDGINFPKLIINSMEIRLSERDEGDGAISLYALQSRGASLFRRFGHSGFTDVRRTHLPCNRHLFITAWVAFRAPSSLFCIIWSSTSRFTPAIILCDRLVQSSSRTTLEDNLTSLQSTRGSPKAKRPWRRLDDTIIRRWRLRQRINNSLVIRPCTSPSLLMRCRRLPRLSGSLQRRLLKLRLVLSSSRSLRLDLPVDRLQTGA